jgi:glycosyltransferase involved in cell wall biosynthesis
MRIAYLARELPCLSETFVVREIAALRRLGMEVKPFSIHPPDAVINPEIPGLVAEVEVLARPRKPLFWLAHLALAVAFPRRYWGCLYDYVLRDRERQGKFWQRWKYFAVAPFAAWHFLSAGIDHVHTHFANVATTVSMMATRLAGISFSFTLHSYYESFIDNLLLPEKLVEAKAVVCTSRHYIDMLRQRYPQAAEARMELVRSGMYVEPDIPGAHKRNTPPVVLSVGRLVGFKGFPTLIQACAALRDRGLDFECKIIGEGPDREKLANLIGSLGLEERVLLLGARQPAEVKTAYQQADLMVLASCASKDPGLIGDRDGLPVVLMEAMAMELPVISTRIAGIPELVLDQKTGMLVDPDDPAGLAEAMARLLEDQGLARRLARAGRNYVNQEFGSAPNALKLQKIFTE